MKSRRYWVGAIGLIVLAAGIWAAAGAGASPAKHTKAAATKVTLQLKWVTQAQFAGYYAAAAEGYYKAAGLDVNLKVGGPNLTPEAGGGGGWAGGASRRRRWLQAAAPTSASTGCPTCSPPTRRASASCRSRRCSRAAA